MSDDFMRKKITKGSRYKNKDQGAGPKGIAATKRNKFNYTDQLALGKTLLIGEGNLSFSKSLLANNKINPANITATTHEPLYNLADDTKENKALLKKQEVTVKHGVDATKIGASLGRKRYDTIAFNFPHLGIRGIDKHQRLLKDFFLSAKHNLQPNGRIIVTLKNGKPYSSWGIKKQAEKAGLKFLDKTDFDFKDFPNYSHTQTKKHGTSAGFSGGASIYIFKE